jgi:hypothetical protein
MPHQVPSGLLWEHVDALNTGLCDTTVASPLSVVMVAVRGAVVTVNT